MAVVFDEVELPVFFTRVTNGGPKGSTTVITNPFSGVSQRNVNRLDQLWEGVIEYAHLEPQELNDLIAFFRCRDAMARGFLLTDYTDFWASSDGTADDPIGTPMQFGTGDGSTTVFGLHKRYTSGGVTRERRIVKPVSGTVSIYKNDVLQTLTTHYTIDYSTGIVTFVAAPTNGHTLKWTGEFYIPVRFATDHFNPSVGDAVTEISLSGLPLMEIAAAEFELSV